MFKNKVLYGRFFVAAAALWALVGCGTAPGGSPEELVAVQNEELSAESCLQSAPIPAGYFRTNCQPGTGGLHIVVCTCDPISPTNPTVALDWSMPDMIGPDPDGDGIVDLSPPSSPPGTPPGIGSYATPSSWNVTLDACGSTPAPTYSWAVTGRPAIPSGTECSVEIQVPTQGTFHATVTANYGNGAKTLSKDITVKNYLVVSMGDSIASGEGNPDVVADWTTDVAKVPLLDVCFAYQIDPFNPSQSHCDSRSFVSALPKWETQSCHRSAKSGPALAALALERSDPHSSVTFLSEACSGAAILEPKGGAPGNGGLLDPYVGEEALPSGNTWAPQLAAIARALCPASANVPTNSVQGWTNPVKSQCRQIDALLLTAGGNDAGFGAAAVDCAVPGTDCSTNASFTQAITKQVAVVPNNLTTLNTSIRNGLNVKSVYVTEYPDPTHDETGKLCSSIRFPHAIDDIVNQTPGYFKREFEKLVVNIEGLLGNDEHDAVIPGDAVKWLHDKLLEPLNSDMATAASANHWIPVTGIASDFQTHGYCSKNTWIVQYPDSVHNQLNSDGTLHPNAMGHADYEMHLFNALVDNLVVGHPPVISKQPVAVTVAAGGNAAFSISDTSSCGLVQNEWQFNGVDLTDGPNVSTANGILQLTNVTAAQAGSYRVIVSCANGVGTTISQAATLTVKPAGTPPVITGQPTTVTVTAGATANLTVFDSTSCGLITEQWQFEGVSLFDGGQISGSATGALTISNVTATQAGSYTLVLTCANGAGSTTSKPITLVVKPSGTSPIVTTQPASLTVGEGTEADFGVALSSSCGAMLLQWQFDGVDLTDGPQVSGSTTQKLVLPSVTAAEAGSYRLLVTCANGAGATLSDVATLTVPTGVIPIFAQPTSVSVVSGSSAWLSVTYTSNCGSVEAQWQVNGSGLVDGPNVSGSNTALLQLSNITSAQAGQYTVFLSCANGAGSAASDPATLTVTTGNAPIITGQPKSVVATAGASASFIVLDATKCGLLHEQWQFNGVNLTDGPSISGSTTGILQLTNVTAAEVGSYQVVISCADGEGTSISQPATLTFPAGAAPVITSQPTSLTVASGASAQFGIGVSTSCGDVVMAWELNGSPLSDGANVTGSQTMLLQLNNVTSAQAGQYQAFVFCVNGAGGTKSSIATLTVH